TLYIQLLMVKGLSQLYQGQRDSAAAVFELAHRAAFGDDQLKTLVAARLHGTVDPKSESRWRNLLSQLRKTSPPEQKILLLSRIAETVLVDQRDVVPFVVRELLAVKRLTRCHRWKAEAQLRIAKLEARQGTLGDEAGDLSDGIAGRPRSRRDLQAAFDRQE